MTLLQLTSTIKEYLLEKEIHYLSFYNVLCTCLDVCHYTKRYDLNKEDFKLIKEFKKNVRIILKKEKVSEYDDRLEFLKGKVTAMDYNDEYLEEPEKFEKYNNDMFSFMKRRSEELHICDELIQDTRRVLRKIKNN